MTCLIVLVFLATSLAWTPMLWPMPVGYEIGDETEMGYFWTNHFITAPDDETYQMARTYLKNLKPYILYDGYRPNSGVSIVRTTISEVATNPIGADESYTLTVTESEITITAVTVFGAFHAYETLLQLIHFDEETLTYKIFQYSVVDEPRFRWRGLMLDTARHFMSIKTLKRQIRGLAAGKMNVLHWHLVDGQSFPWMPESIRHMYLGSYRNQYYYTSEEIQEVVDYAKSWGVAVVPELDMPGHAYSWREGEPTMIPECPETAAQNLNSPAMDPRQERTYTVIDELMRELIDITGSGYFHSGGDEVDTSCWHENEEMDQWMEDNSMDDDTLVELFHATLVEQWPEGTRQVVWQEVLTDGHSVRDDAIVTAWLSKNVILDITAAGHNALLSAGWYLDIQQPGQSRYGWHDTWKDFYTNEPTAIVGITDEQKEMILGGECCMWAEGTDSGNMDAMVWPRTLAAAERMWSPQEVNDTNEAIDRLQQHRCNLVRRGIWAGPVFPNEPCWGEFLYWSPVFDN